jgi:hypothetical protein
MFGDVISKTHNLQLIDINNNPFYYLNKNNEIEIENDIENSNNIDYDFEKDFEFKELIFEYL